MEIAVTDDRRVPGRAMRAQPAHQRLQPVERAPRDPPLERVEIPLVRPGRSERARQRRRIERVQPELEVGEHGAHAEGPRLEQRASGPPLHQHERRAERRGVGRRQQHARGRKAQVGEGVLRGLLTQRHRRVVMRP